MKKRVFVIEGLAFIFIGIVFLFNSFSSITGAVVLENVDVNVSALLGLVFVVAGLIMMMSGRNKTKLGILEQVLKGTPASLPTFSSVDSGVNASEELSPFNVLGRGYFIYVSSKKDAADIANYLVRGRRLYEDKNVARSLGKRARSLDIKKLESLKNSLKKFRPKVIGFGRGEYDTSIGRAWEMEALYHEPHPGLGINYPHYNITYNPKGSKRKKELHILIKKD